MKKFFIILKINIKKILLISFLLLIPTVLFFPEHILKLEKVNKLIIVTGKGLHSDNESNPYVSKDLSILKYSVPEFIKSNQSLMKLINSFGEATIEDGGSGAFYILLKKKL